MTDLRIEYLPVNALKPYMKNARKHSRKDIEAIKASIHDFEFDDPIGIWGSENLIVEGHGRLIAAQELGMETVPCIRLDHLTEEQRRAYALAHNRTAELSMWDEMLKHSELREIHAFDMTAFGFEKSEPEVVEDDYNPQPPAKPKSRRGDLYLLGRHRLLCGDSTCADDVRRLMDGKEADMLLTDPPYNVDVEEKAGKIMNDNLPDQKFREFLAAAFSCATNVMRGGAAFHIWHANTEGYNFMGACRDVGLQVRQVLIWCKKNATIGRQDFQWQHEPCLAGFIEDTTEEDTETPTACLYGWKGGASHRWYKKRKEKTLLYFDKPVASKEHPTMKPVLLFDYEMQCNTQQGDAVLDLFGGSGTTVIAAEQNGRDAYVMELDPKYCDVIVDRWEKFTGQTAELVREGTEET